MKYVFDLEDGTYILIGRDGALHFDTGSDEAIKFSIEGLGIICKLEEYKEEAKMIKDCCVCINSYGEALREHRWTIPNDEFNKLVPDEQSAKADAGKPKLTLVPQQIIYDIAEVREYGNEKYGDPDNWRTVEPERYRDAAFRHFLKYLSDPYGVDEESGISHLKHLACNIAFLCEMEKEEINGQRKTM